MTEYHFTYLHKEFPDFYYYMEWIQNELSIHFHLNRKLYGKNRDNLVRAYIILNVPKIVNKIIKQKKILFNLKDMIIGVEGEPTFNELNEALTKEAILYHTKFKIEYYNIILFNGCSVNDLARKTLILNEVNYEKNKVDSIISQYPIQSSQGEEELNAFKRRVKLRTLSIANNEATYRDL